MPCGCRIPVPNYPDNVEWGPIVWRILHGLAEHTGRAYSKDTEIRAWQKLFRLTAQILPCDKCNEHMAEFIIRRPLTYFTVTSNLRTTIRTWLWDLHNEVNVRNQKPIYPFENLSEYSSVNIQDLLLRLDPVIKRALRIKTRGLLNYLHWCNTVKTLRAIFGIQ